MCEMETVQPSNVKYSYFLCISVCDSEICLYFSGVYTTEIIFLKLSSTNVISEKNHSNFEMHLSLV
jgi:hypothetical protein